MKFILAVFAMFFLLGCSSGGFAPESNTTNDPNGTTTTTPSLLYEQWSIHYNADFYNQNSIDVNANINGDSIYQNFTGKGIKVAVIDDGFDVNHPEIKNKIIATVSVLSDGTVISDVSHDTAQGYHGTSTTGIIAASDDGNGTKGIAPDVSLILIKIPTQTYNDVVGIKAFDEALQYGADVISCSWGTGSVSDAVRDKINQVATSGRNGKGTIVIFASGNDNIDMTNDESSIVNVIGVGATDKSNLRTSYSNYGKDLDVVAPGGYSLGIATLDPLGTNGQSDDGYNRYDQTKDGVATGFIGTSAAAPIVSAIAALALEKNYSLTREQFMTLLEEHADKIGLNIPYIDDMISSSSSTPTISGKTGSSGNNNFNLYVVANDTNTSYGPYSISFNGDNTWDCSVTNTLNDGNYSIYLRSSSDNTVLAVDDNFEINGSVSDQKDTAKSRNNYYGYGKVNLGQLMGNIN